MRDCEEGKPIVDDMCVCVCVCVVTGVVSTQPWEVEEEVLAGQVMVLALSSAPVQAAGTDSQSLGEQDAWAPRIAAAAA